MPERTCKDCGVNIDQRGRAAKSCESCAWQREVEASRQAMRKKYVPKPVVARTHTCIDCKSTWEQASRFRSSQRCEACRDVHRSEVARQRRAVKLTFLPIRPCEFCGADYGPRAKSDKFCSQRCQVAAHCKSGKRRQTARTWALKAKFQMTNEEFDRLLRSQGGMCANPGCRSTDPGGAHGQWNIDHDHSCCSGTRTCGECVRGLLCNRCNRAAGQMSDSPEALRGLAQYLERHGRTRHLSGIQDERPLHQAC